MSWLEIFAGVATAIYAGPLLCALSLFGLALAGFGALAALGRFEAWRERRKRGRS